MDASSSIVCEICMDQFSIVADGPKAPLFLYCCGHSACKDCFLKLPADWSVGGSKRCPFCREAFSRSVETMPKNLALIQALEQLRQATTSSSSSSLSYLGASGTTGAASSQAFDTESASLFGLRQQQQRIEETIRKRERNIAEDAVVPDLQVVRAKHKLLSANAATLRTEAEGLEREAAQLESLASGKRLEARGKRATAESRRTELNSLNNRIRDLEKVASERLSCWVAGYGDQSSSSSSSSGKRTRSGEAASGVGVGVGAGSSDESWSTYYARVNADINASGYKPADRLIADVAVASNLLTSNLSVINDPIRVAIAALHPLSTLVKSSDTTAATLFLHTPNSFENFIKVADRLVEDSRTFRHKEAFEVVLTVLTNMCSVARGSQFVDMLGFKGAICVVAKIVTILQTFSHQTLTLKTFDLITLLASTIANRQHFAQHNSLENELWVLAERFRMSCSGDETAEKFCTTFESLCKDQYDDSRRRFIMMGICGSLKSILDHYGFSRDSLSRDPALRLSDLMCLHTSGRQEFVNLGVLKTLNRIISTRDVPKYSKNSALSVKRTLGY